VGLPHQQQQQKQGRATTLRPLCIYQVENAWLRHYKSPPWPPFWFVCAGLN